MLFTVAKLEDFVPADHPLRPIRVQGVIKEQTASRCMHAAAGRASKGITANRPSRRGHLPHLGDEAAEYSLSADTS